MLTLSGKGLAKTKHRTNVKTENVAKAGKHTVAVRVFQRFERSGVEI
jgi:hypothetical protein